MTCFSKSKITKFNADGNIIQTHNNLNVNNLCCFSDEMHIVLHQLQNPVVIDRILIADTSALNDLERVEINLYRLDAVAERMRDFALQKYLLVKTQWCISSPSIAISDTD